MRYDVEVSGFPSSHCGHLCLLRLKEDDYPGTSRIDEWPSWDLPILKWGKSQGGVVGFAHSGWGLHTAQPGSAQLRDAAVRRHRRQRIHRRHGRTGPATSSRPSTRRYPWEMNIWYHTLNCGFTTRISGETDFPCIYGERVGLGRAYVKSQWPAARLTTPGPMACATAAAIAATGIAICSISRSRAWASASPATAAEPACWQPERASG